MSSQDSTPANVYYSPDRPACLEHGWGHWTKDCPDLTIPTLYNCNVIDK